MKNKIAFTKDSRQILLIAIIVVVVLGTAFLLMDYWDKKADMYLIPEGFQGTATIYFDQPLGTPEKKDGEKRIFEIPATGILYTKSSYKKKWINYYYVKPDGKLQQLMFGDARAGGIPISYSSFDSVWVQEMKVAQLDTDGRNVTIATITIKQMQ